MKVLVLFIICTVAYVILFTIQEFKDNKREAKEFNIGEKASIETENVLIVDKVNAERCPECGESLINTGGCTTCTNCGWSKCS